MRIRTKVLVGLGCAAMTTGIVAGGAVGHGGEGKHGGKKRAKLAKVSKVGQNALRVEVRGKIMSIDDKQVTVKTAAYADPWTCMIPAGSDVQGFKEMDHVRLNCRSSEGTLYATKLRKRDKGERLKIHARGVLGTFSDTVVTVDPGTATDMLGPVTCVRTATTLVIGAVAVGKETKVECKAKTGTLKAKKVVDKTPAPPAP
jgi:hypothetical protein